jgi:hypothetical protein
MNFDDEERIRKLQAIVEPITQELDEFQKKTVRPTTTTEYRRICARMENSVNTEMGFTLSDSITYRNPSRSTFYKRLAAIDHVRLGTVIQWRDKGLAAVEAHETDFEFDWILWKLKEAVGGWQSFHELRSYVRPTEGARPRQSLRKRLRKFPTDWRERICDQMTFGKYGYAAWVTALVGARPAELLLGARIWLTPCEAPTRLSVKILGAKVTENSGQPWREIVFRIGAEEENYLLSCLAHLVWLERGEVMVKIENSCNFTMALTRAGRKLWPHITKSVTAYCFRHAASADAKSTLPSGEVAAFLGHASVRTQKFYGQRQQSRGGCQLPIESIQVAREIRHVDEIKKAPPSRTRGRTRENEPE